MNIRNNHQQSKVQSSTVKNTNSSMFNINEKNVIIVGALDSHDIFKYVSITCFSISINKVRRNFITSHI